MFAKKRSAGHSARSADSSHTVKWPASLGGNGQHDARRRRRAMASVFFGPVISWARGFIKTYRRSGRHLAVDYLAPHGVQDLGKLAGGIVANVIRPGRFPVVLSSEETSLSVCAASTTCLSWSEETAVYPILR